MSDAIKRLREELTDGVDLEGSQLFALLDIAEAAQRIRDRGAVDADDWRALVAALAKLEAP